MLHFHLFVMDKKYFNKQVFFYIDIVDCESGEIVHHGSLKKSQFSRSDFYIHLDLYLRMIDKYPNSAIQFHVLPEEQPLSMFEDSDDESLDDLESVIVAGTKCYILP